MNEDYYLFTEDNELIDIKDLWQLLKLREKDIVDFQKWLIDSKPITKQEDVKITLSKIIRCTSEYLINLFGKYNSRRILFELANFHNDVYEFYVENSQVHISV